MRERKYWLGFLAVKGVGPVRTQALIDKFGSLEQSWDASPFELKQAGFDSRAIENLQVVKSQIDLDAEVARLDKLGIAVLTWDDPEYPVALSQLRHINQAPPVIFIRGTLLPQDEWAIAVVGSRSASSYGKAVTESIAHELALNKVTIVSGLARGIDSIAHQAAIDTGGRTIAVLPCGLDRIYPPENRQLASKIIRNGALISIFPIGSVPDKRKFPIRNQVMSGMAKGVLVTEATDKSGALITAGAALNQGRDVFAIPGNITSRSSMGVNRLIQDGAHPVLSADDIMEVMNFEKQVAFSEVRRTLPDLSETEEAIFSVLTADPKHIDEIVRQTKLGVADVSSALTFLQLKGLAVDYGKKMISRKEI